MLRLITLAMSLCIASAILAQSPSRFSYQAIARDAQGIQLATQDVSLLISILEGSASGTAVFSETHDATTNAYGLFNLMIGTGSNQSGNLSAIAWGQDEFFIKVELDPAGGNNYTIVSTTQLVSVPYAMYADHVANDSVDDADADPENEIQVLSFSADQLDLSLNGGSVDLSGYDQSADVAQNASDIADNASDIAQNTSDIADNTSDIADNASDIATHTSNDLDLSPTNELISSVSLSNDSIIISEAGDEHGVSLISFVDDGDWDQYNDSLYNLYDHLAVGGLASKRHQMIFTSDSGHVIGIRRSFTDPDPNGLSIGFDLYDFVSSADTVVGVKTDVYQPSSGVVVSNWNKIEGFPAGSYGVYNRIHYGNDTAMGVYNVISDVNGIGYGMVNLIRDVDVAGYGVYNTISDHSGDAIGMYNDFDDGGNQQIGVYNDLDTSLNQSYGVLTRIDGSGGPAYGSYSRIEYPAQQSFGSYNYITSNNASSHYGSYNYIYQYGTGDAVGAYNLGYRGSGNDPTAFGIGSENYGYNYNDDVNGYAYGTANNAYSHNGTNTYAHGSYNYGYTNGSTNSWAYGTYGSASAGSGNYRNVYGVFGYALGGNNDNWAGYFNGTTYSVSGYYSSDAKLKKNIRDFEGGLEAILSLEPKRYEFDLASFPTMALPEESQIGLVAQDVSAVFPELVTSVSNPSLVLPKSQAERLGVSFEVIQGAHYDEEGKLLEEERVLAGDVVEFKAVNYNGLIPVLIKAVQEQQEIIDTLEGRIEELENQ